MSGRAEVHKLRTRLNATIERAPGAGAEAEVQADFAKYLCVLVSGFLESAITAMLVAYAKSRSGPEVASFVERQLGPWTNPKAEKIIDLFGAFNADWRADLTAYFVDEPKDSVNGLVALRHKIAHGESVGTSLFQVKRHYAIILKVVQHLEDLVDPQP